MKTSIITFGILFVILSGSASASMNYGTAIEKLTSFLEKDDTNLRFNWQNTPSSAYVYHVLRNASFQNITMGRAYFYNETERTTGYVFGYYITSENNVLFIDAQTDKILTYDQATTRYKASWKPASMRYVKYYKYYPYLYYEGVGMLDKDMIRSTIIATED